MLERLVPLRGKSLLDVGCGDGALVRELAARGKQVVGLEISEDRLATAVARDADSGARYLIGRAQALPLADASVDVTVFMRTLHHVPATDLMEALREARRVLRPDGVVYVAEPLPQGDYFALTSLVEDEAEARTAAQGALARAGAVGLDRAVTVDYDVQISVAGPAALRTRIVSVDPDRVRAYDVCEARIVAALGELGEAGDQEGERSFLQPMRADVLRAAAGWP